MNEILNVDEALIALKEGLILKDKLSTKFIFKKSRIYVYSTNSSYKLSCNDFTYLYKDSEFVIEDFSDSTIDLEKDKEYYSFKHK